MSDKKKKLKIAIGLGATCSGCDIAILDLNEKILDLTGIADIVFWPTAMDFKKDDVEALKDGEIDVTIFHGAIRTKEHERMAKLLRQKSKAVVAFGSCSCFGGIPSLANLSTKENIFNTAYVDNPTTENPKRVLPDENTVSGFLDKCGALEGADYFLPGCPPSVELIAELVKVAANFHAKGELPPKGAVIAGEKTLCDVCTREKPKKIVIEKFNRPHEVSLDEKKCFLVQGVLCLGPATRSGCGERCLKGNMPCRGCMGPTGNVRDHGAKALSSIASLVQLEREGSLSDSEITSAADKLADPAGSFYRFTTGVSPIGRMARKKTI